MRLSLLALASLAASISAQPRDPYTWSSVSSPRKAFAAAMLQNGEVLFIGGSDGTNSLVSTDVFDPSGGVVSAGPNLMMPRAALTANSLLDGTVLIVGGNDGTEDLASAEIYVRAYRELEKRPKETHPT
jgi:hypothetical protein